MRTCPRMWMQPLSRLPMFTKTHSFCPSFLLSSLQTFAFKLVNFTSRSIKSWSSSVVRQKSGWRSVMFTLTSPLSIAARFCIMGLEELFISIRYLQRRPSESCHIRILMNVHNVFRRVILSNYRFQTAHEREILQIRLVNFQSFGNRLQNRQSYQRLSAKRIKYPESLISSYKSAIIVLWNWSLINYHIGTSWNIKL